MTIRLGPVQTARAIDILQNIIETFVMHGISPTAQDACMQHLTWMRQQKPNLNVNCHLETIPELQATKVNLVFSFSELPPTGQA